MTKNIRIGATIYTDEHKSYNDLYRYNRQSVNYSRKEYVRGEIHTNGIESFWALLKRGYYETFHHFPREHAMRYANEFATRLNQNGCDTEDVLAITIKNSVGKNLPYKVLTQPCLDQ